MKKLWTLLLAVCVAFVMAAVPVYAEDTSRVYSFALTVDTKNEVTVLPGEIITVQLILDRLVGPEEMYAMQDEIQYDSDFFEFVEDSDVVYEDVKTTDILLMGNMRAHYFNFVSMDGGKNWPSSVTVGSFQLKVAADAGVSIVSNQNYHVSNAEGTQSFAVTAKDLKVIVSTDCTVRFESNGGSTIENQIVSYGELIQKPENPVRDGFVFQGWYKNIDRTEQWDFERDTVTENMTLYAGWNVDTTVVVDENTEATTILWGVGAILAVIIVCIIVLLCTVKRVTFETGCRRKIKPVYVLCGRKLTEPPKPTRYSAEFVGWSASPEGDRLWDFENTTVRRNMKLYAVWR